MFVILVHGVGVGDRHVPGLSSYPANESPCLRKTESSGESIPRAVPWFLHVHTQLGIGYRFGPQLVTLFCVILEISGMVPHLENWVTEGMLFKGAWVHFISGPSFSFPLLSIHVSCGASMTGYRLCNVLIHHGEACSPPGSMAESSEPKGQNQ